MAEKITRTVSAREACLNSLIRHEKTKVYSDTELSRALGKNNFNDLDRAFFTRLFYGVIEKKLTLDFYINRLVEKNKDIYISNILRMGIYQILYMEKVPDSAACSESVELAKKLKNKHAAGFVNAVLRNYLRKKEELEQKLNSLNNLEIKYSCNYDIINTWEESYGLKTAEKILKAAEYMGQGFTVTVNSLKISRDEYLKKLTALGIKCEKVSEYGVDILENLPIKSLYGFFEGLFFVQDAASQFCALELGAKKGDVILDVCAAPGGKSLFIAQAIGGKGKIIALDLYKHRLKLIDNSADRLGIDIIKTYEHNSAEPIPENILTARADCILCDVPCSGLGTAVKKPEIKYKSLENMTSLTALQYDILSNCSNYLKPGGTLVYSTCTLNKKENEDVVGKFLEKNVEFKLENIKTFFPFERRTDGFFFAKMRLV